MNKRYAIATAIVATTLGITSCDNTPNPTPTNTLVPHITITPTPAEDDPNFDCRIHGNRVCSAIRECDTIGVTPTNGRVCTPPLWHIPIA